jgi:hypothetical protein
MSATAASPQETPLLQRYGSILSQFAEAKNLRAAGSQGAAKQMVATASKQYAAWLVDWQAFQRASGLKVTTPSPPKGARH